MVATDENAKTAPDVVVVPMDGDLSSDSDISEPAATPASTRETWQCVAGSYLFLMVSFGAMQSVGVIQSYLTLHQLEAYPIRDIGWVTGLYTFLGTFLGLFVGNLVDTYGPMKLAPFAFVLVVPTYVLLAECTQYWHFMLCLGVLGGAGASWASMVAISVVGKLPLRRRGLAMGASLTGASSGGIVYPLMLRGLFPAVGWAWSMRIVALLKAVLIVAGLLCYLPLFRGRIQLQGQKLARSSAEAAASTVPARKGMAKFVDLTAFLSPAFATLAVGFFFLEYALFAVSGILPTFAAFAGFSPESGYTLIAIMNTCQVPGRVLPGLLADRIGHFDVFLLSIIVTMIPVGALFVPFGAKSIGALYAFAALWGFTSSAWLALVPVCVAKTCEPQEFGKYFGCLTFSISFAALICMPTVGQFLQEAGLEASAGLILVCTFVGGCFVFTGRGIISGKYLGWRSRM